MRAALSLVVLAAACGGGGGARSAPARTGPVDPTAAAAGPDDVVVARVDGRPVYGSCVAAQAAAHRLDRRAALDECVAFELLAGAASARGLAADPEVAAAARAAAATRLVDVEFSARYRQWSDLPAQLTGPALEQNAARMNRPESRASFLVRLEIGDGDAGGPLDLAAGEAIARAYQTLAARADLFPPDVEAAAKAAASADPALAAAMARPDATTKVVGVRPDPTAADAGLREYYRKALFAIPAIGQVAPPVRSPWGWDLILWTDVRKPPPMTRDQLAASLFEGLRVRWFGIWSTGLAKQHRITVADEATLQKLWGPPAAAPPGPR